MSEWKQLLARCQQWHLDQAEWQRRSGEQFVPDPPPTTFAPATEVQIAREEAKLGVRLPPSLRSFYLHSNGHAVVGNFIWAVRPVEQLGWLRDVEPEFHEIIFEDDPASARSLLVSGEADASHWLLDPGGVDGRGEWRAGRWSSWNPGMSWLAADFLGLFENEVATAELLLAREKSPPPPPGTGRPRNAQSVGDVNSTAVPTRSLARNGYLWVPAEGFASVVTLSAPALARVGEWCL
jgi:SMI1 / KNR4 family (SUKH-1)